MRYVNKVISTGSDNTIVTSDIINANQLVSVSFLCYFGDATANGIFKVQASNDPFPDGYQPSNFTPTNWCDVPSQSATITLGCLALLTIANSTYRWLRTTYTPGAGAQTITTVADVANSLNNKYFYISAGNLGTNYYVWYNVSAGGTDPAIPGKTGIEVDISTGASANTVATATAAALAAVGSTNVFTAPAPAANVITVTNKTAGPYVFATAQTSGFTIALSAGGTSTINVAMNGLSI